MWSAFECKKVILLCPIECDDREVSCGDREEGDGLDHVYEEGVDYVSNHLAGMTKRRRKACHVYVLCLRQSIIKIGRGGSTSRGRLTPESGKQGRVHVVWKERGKFPPCLPLQKRRKAGCLGSEGAMPVDSVDKEGGMPVDSIEKKRGRDCVVDVMVSALGKLLMLWFLVVYIECTLVRHFLASFLYDSDHRIVSRAK